MVLKVAIGILIINYTVNDLTNSNLNMNVQWKQEFEIYDILIQTVSNIQMFSKVQKQEIPYICLIAACNFVTNTSLIDKIGVLKIFFKSYQKELIGEFLRTIAILLTYKVSDKYGQ